MTFGNSATLHAGAYDDSKRGLAVTPLALCVRCKSIPGTFKFANIQCILDFYHITFLLSTVFMLSLDSNVWLFPFISRGLKVYPARYSPGIIFSCEVLHYRYVEQEPGQARR